MGIGRSLINKLKRRRKSSNKNRGFRQQDKIDRKDEVLADSPSVYKYLRGIRRRQDADFGQQIQPSAEYKPGVEKLVECDLEVASGTATLTFASASLLAEIGAQPGDIVEFLTGTLKGDQMTVDSLPNADELEMAEAASVSPVASETVQVKIQISGVKRSFK